MQCFITFMILLRKILLYSYVMYFYKLAVPRDICLHAKLRKIYVVVHGMAAHLRGNH